MCTSKVRALSYIGAEKITFPPKPDRQTYRHTYRQTCRHTYRRTDISVYRVASLLNSTVFTSIDRSLYPTDKYRITTSYEGIIIHLPLYYFYIKFTY